MCYDVNFLITKKNSETALLSLLLKLRQAKILFFAQLYNEPPAYAITACVKFIVAEYQDALDERNYNLCFFPPTMDSGLSEKASLCLTINAVSCIPRLSNDDLGFSKCRIWTKWAGLFLPCLM